MSKLMAYARQIRYELDYISNLPIRRGGSFKRDQLLSRLSLDRSVSPTLFCYDRLRPNAWLSFNLDLFIWQHAFMRHLDTALVTADDNFYD